MLGNPHEIGKLERDVPQLTETGNPVASGVDWERLARKRSFQYGLSRPVVYREYMLMFVAIMPVKWSGRLRNGKYDVPRDKDIDIPG